jgi:ppGpp synthetase/RelA/SpoT-type nucleotidyltranferase
VDADQYERLHRQCESEHSVWVQVADITQGRLREELQRRGIEAEVSGRAKSVESLLRKLVFKYQSMDTTRVPDRSGVRVVVHLPSQVADTCDAIRTRFNVVREEDMSARYDSDQFSYRGIHLDVIVADAALDPTRVVGPTLCEIQVRSVAEHAWSSFSHLVTYKAPGADVVPNELQRRINRLIAMVELFDQEARNTYTEITSRPEHVAQRLIFDAEKLHFATVGDLVGSMTRCDPSVVDVIIPLYQCEQNSSTKLRNFVEENGERLRGVVGANGPAISPLIQQPEAFLLWERLDFDSVEVVRHWDASGFPHVMLENVAIAWGIDLPDL